MMKKVVCIEGYRFLREQHMLTIKRIVAKWANIKAYQTHFIQDKRIEELRIEFLNKTEGWSKKFQGEFCEVVFRGE